MPPEDKGEKCAKRGKTCRLRSHNGVDYGGPLRTGTIKQEEKGSSGNGRWAREPERARQFRTSRALKRKPMVVQPKYRNTLRATYAGDQYDASGRQRGTLILFMGPTRAINGTPMVDNVRLVPLSATLSASSRPQYEVRGNL